MSQFTPYQDQYTINNATIMPSRFLPRTDNERSRALQNCQKQFQSTPAPRQLITSEQFNQIGTLLAPWTEARGALGKLLAAQVGTTSHANTAFTRCVRVISHFIQVLNFAIERGELQASVRARYRLVIKRAAVPVINTTADALLWAERLAAGEARRVAAGGAPLSWPSIGAVTAAATELQTRENAQSSAKEAYDRGQEAVARQRSAVNALIVDLWDTIDYRLRRDKASSRRRKARAWGVTYRGDLKGKKTTKAET